jgi:ABC-2 type transport system permease protein
MKTFHIILKDLVHSLRSPFVLAFMLVLPLLQAGLPYLAFNGLTKGLEVQSTRLQIVNLDRPVAQYPDFLAGDLLIETFQSDGLEDLLVITEAPNEAAARLAVENRQADVALIIPADFTASLFDAGRHAEIVLYQDPALTLGPAIVRDVVTNFTDGFAGSLMATDVTTAQLEAAGRTVPEATRLTVMQNYGDWAQTVGDSLSRGVHPAIRYAASPAVQESGSVMKAMIGPLMLGMLVFFAFFVGAITAQSILREEEQGTLARLYRTSASRISILMGKFGAVAGVLTLQALLLLGTGSLVFGIDWGRPLPVLVNALGLVFAAAGFSVMLISCLRSTRQAFLVMGGAAILTGMAGGTMTTTFANLPAAYRTLNLFTPQGWIMRGFEAAMRGGSPLEVFLPAVVAAGIGLLCLAVGLFNLNRRFS